MKTVVNLADMQAGSIFAIAPPKIYHTFLDDNDKSRKVRVELNGIQKILCQKWYELAKKWHKPDVLVCVGEAVEGVRKPKEVWSSNEQDQIDAAETLIRAFEPKEVWFLVATDWHTCIGGVYLDELLANRFGKNRYRMDLSLQVENVKIHYAHHISVSASVFQYRTTPLAKELAFNLLNLHHLHDYDIVVRGHCHYMVEVGFGSHYGIILPAWQTRTPYTIRKNPLGMIPSIGAVRFIIDKNTFSVEKELMHLPKPKLEKVC